MSCKSSSEDEDIELDEDCAGKGEKKVYGNNLVIKPRTARGLTFVRI
jgi:hypothetical protein